ncbi:helix-turn-helix domain-containing protein [Streptomyces xiamenensis]|uniref:helix-turn-helix domain-containing protein n=1 Tax=Streptomyces xiamenensis TaxID=408015 RepID=UPI0037D49A5D
MPQDPLPEWLRDQRLEVGRRVREARVWANLTQEALAHRLGVERTTIVRIELGITSPPVDRLLAIARELGVPPSQLLPGG